MEGQRFPDNVPAEVSTDSSAADPSGGREQTRDRLHPGAPSAAVAARTPSGQGTRGAALNNFTVTLAKEVAPDIQVNAVAPGFVATPYYDSLPPATREGFVRGALTKRFVNATEVADGFVSLVEADSVS